MNEFNIKPASDAVRVRDPRTGRALAKDGETKPRNSYWLRRLRDCDVVEVAASTSSASKAAPVKADAEQKGGKS
ncbi:MAG: DUF2635 domain-containing protein [Gammaproteobacteria bacterium]